MHAIRALRLQRGDHILVFDGTGHEWECEVLETGTLLRARILEHRNMRREPSRRITMAVAVPKGWRLDYMVEKIAELGAARLVPLRFARSVARVEGPKLERLRRVATAASKQCGRATVLEIVPEERLAQFQPCGEMLMGRAESDETILDVSLGSEVTMVIGPEGGFTTEEEEALRNRGARSVRLGPSILRIETAALAALSFLALR